VSAQALFAARVVVIVVVRILVVVDVVLNEVEPMSTSKSGGNGIPSFCRETLLVVVDCLGTLVVVVVVTIGMVVVVD